MREGHRIILVDPSEQVGSVLGGRLRMQGFIVDETPDPADGARLALSNPPSALVADLWMPGISGVQLCRLLTAEAATAHVPIVLRGPDDPRNRFWAERAGAAGYAVKGRIGDLVRTVSRAIAAAPPSDGFFTELSGAASDIRDRIAAHLDAALFESVLAAEVRALGTCGAFDRLFDLFSQFVSQVTTYRWLALSTETPRRLGLHTSPALRKIAEIEAREALELPEDANLLVVEDDDAFDDLKGPAAIVRRIELGPALIGHMALAVCESQSGQFDMQLAEVVARELAGPMRVVSLMEESQRLATIDPLTGLMNRRAFLAALEIELERAQRAGTSLAALLLDVDHFKHINDRFGHATGDVVLTAVGKALTDTMRKVDLVARWGGEEFVMVLHNTDHAGAQLVAERTRRALENLVVHALDGVAVPVTASFGAALLRSGDTIDSVVDRADRAMYEAKAAGRNRVVIASNAPAFPSVH